MYLIDYLEEMCGPNFKWTFKKWIKNVDQMKKTKHLWRYDNGQYYKWTNLVWTKNKVGKM